MNLSLYSVNAFIILDTEGHRVLAKYYRPKSHPQGESKDLLTLKEQKAFEKGLWQKTKKPGGMYGIHRSKDAIIIIPWLTDLKLTCNCRRHHPIRLSPRCVQAFA